jgi:hypothetical protein
MSKEFGIFTNPSNMALAGALAARATGAGFDVDHIEHPFDLGRHKYDYLGVAGGDGTLQMLLKYLFLEGRLEDVKILLVGGGSSNATLLELKSIGATVTLDKAFSENSPSNFARINPGLFGECPFMTDAALGTSWVRIAYFGRILEAKNMKGTVRTALAAVAGGILGGAVYNGDEPIFELYSTSTRYGRRKEIIPGHDLRSNKITRTVVRGNGKVECAARNMIAIAALGFGLKPILRNVTETEIGEQFIVRRVVDTIRSDGELTLMNPQANIVVRRAEKESVTVAALAW